MPKIIVSIDTDVVKEISLTKDRTSLGRRPYNDIVIDNLAVSGEHAVFQMSGTDVYVEDLNSTNGTYVNGKAVKKQLLRNTDAIEIGKYKIRYTSEAAGAEPEKSASLTAPIAPVVVATIAPVTSSAAPTTTPMLAGATHGAAIKVLSGAAAGREVALIKVVTTIGKPGVAVAAITRRPQGFVVAHVEGADKPLINGTPIGAEPIVLKNGDVLELAGTKMQFLQR